jgi:hypothetical protein
MNEPRMSLEDFVKGWNDMATEFQYPNIGRRESVQNALDELAALRAVEHGARGLRSAAVALGDALARLDAVRSGTSW